MLYLYVHFHFYISGDINICKNKTLTIIKKYMIPYPLEAYSEFDLTKIVVITSILEKFGAWNVTLIDN